MNFNPVACATVAVLMASLAVGCSTPRGNQQDLGNEISDLRTVVDRAAADAAEARAIATESQADIARIRRDTANAEQRAAEAERRSAANEEALDQMFERSVRK